MGWYNPLICLAAGIIIRADLIENQSTLFNQSDWRIQQILTLTLTENSNESLLDIKLLSLLSL